MEQNDVILQLRGGRKEGRKELHLSAVAVTFTWVTQRAHWSSVKALHPASDPAPQSARAGLRSNIRRGSNIEMSTCKSLHTHDIHSFFFVAFLYFHTVNKHIGPSPVSQTRSQQQWLSWQLFALKEMQMDGLPTGKSVASVKVRRVHNSSISANTFADSNNFTVSFQSSSVDFPLCVCHGQQELFTSKSSHPPCEVPKSGVGGSPRGREGAALLAVALKEHDANSQNTPRHLYWCNYDNKNTA